MPILPQNTDPSKDYVTQGVNPALTIDGVVYNKIYPHTGVIDALSNVENTGYSDPNLNIISSANIVAFNQELQTSWISDTDFGGPTSNPVVLTYSLVNTTYYNNISLDILNVPCYVELLDQNMNPLVGTSSFTIGGGNDIYTTTNWVTLSYTAPATNTGIGAIILRITRNKTVQISNNGILSNAAYSVGVQNFSIKLVVENKTDIPAAVASGTASIITQNRFGFVENYSYLVNSLSNIFNNDSTYWKSAPQPTKDSIVFFYAKVSDPTPSLVNRIYIDPLYSGCKFNVYWTTATTSGNTVDPSTFIWSPIQRDFSLRKGAYEIPNVVCTYLKFEFVKLIPEIYDLPTDQIEKTINVFPYDVESYYNALEQNIIDGNAVKYSYVNSSNIQTTQNQVSNQVNASTLFGVSTNALGNSNNWSSLSYLNSTQLGDANTVGINTNSFIFDPTISYKLLDSAGQYNNQTYTEFLQRRFIDARVHNYNQVTVSQTWHEAYFTGIRYITAFYENSFDDLRGTPQNLVAKNGSNTGFTTQDLNYVGLSVDDTATTPWFSTIDNFTSFNIGGLTTDWRSFLTQSFSIPNDPTLMNNLTGTNLTRMSINSTLSKVGTLGVSSIYSVVQSASGSIYGIQSMGYPVGTNILSFYDANFTPISGTAFTSWSGLGGTTITGTQVTYFNPLTNLSGTASGLLVNGGAYSAAYNFTIPNTNASGIAPWQIQFGAPAIGVVGFGSYVPGSGVSYYFLSNVQAVGGTTNVNIITRYINPTTGTVISGTTVSGSTVVASGGNNTLITVTGTNYSGGIPSNTIQVVFSGTAANSYALYQLGAFTTPTSTWIGPSDHSNMRISGVIRMLLPNTNIGTYRASLFAVDANGATSEIAYKIYPPGSMPLNTWFDVELSSYTGTNYTSFTTMMKQTSTSVNETFYVSMLAPFYHPIRYEFITQSGATNWQPITGGVNNPNYLISTVGGVAASGIQVRMTGLDPNVFVAGVSIVPKYTQSPYYANLDIDYVGSSKTNEVSIRRSIDNKPYFQLNQDVHPAIFDIDRISSIVNSYPID